MLDLPNLTVHDWRHVTPEMVADMTADELLDTYAVALAFICRPGLRVGPTPRTCCAMRCERVWARCAEEEAVMTYRLVQLAPGSYDVERDGKIIASLVRDSLATNRWSAELLDERLLHPAPFTGTRHKFGSFAEAVTWLGNPEVHARKLQALKRKRS